MRNCGSPGITMPKASCTPPRLAVVKWRSSASHVLRRRELDFYGDKLLTTENPEGGRPRTVRKIRSETRGGGEEGWWL